MVWNKMPGKLLLHSVDKSIQFLLGAGNIRGISMIRRREMQSDTVSLPLRPASCYKCVYFIASVGMMIIRVSGGLGPQS